MATKTITIKKSAYDILTAKKEDGESFSDVIERELGGGDIDELFGILDEEDAAAIEDEIAASRERSRGRSERLAEEL